MARRQAMLLQRLALAFHGFVSRVAEWLPQTLQFRPCQGPQPPPPESDSKRALPFTHPSARTPAIISSSFLSKSNILSRNFLNHSRRVIFPPFDCWDL